MDRLMRARVFLAEAAALGVTIEDLVAESSGSPDGPSVAPTVAEYVETVEASFSKGGADPREQTKGTVFLSFIAPDPKVEAPLFACI
jgi:hypothetical protein